MSVPADPGASLSELLSVEEARQRILSLFTPVSTEEVQFDTALGRILAQDIQSPLSLPQFDNSSMDGFAVRSIDVLDATQGNPVLLNVIGDIPAGKSLDHVIGAGQAARIMTGAPLPFGADTVIPQEETDFSRSHEHQDLPKAVQIFRNGPPGQYVRKAGSDIIPGQIILRAGRQIKAADIGMLAMLGIILVKVHRQVTVAVLSTGDELISPHHPLAPGKIRDSNSYMLAALVRQAGAEIRSLGFVGDSYEQVKKCLDHAVQEGADLIITSAGVSVGAYDYVRTVVESAGRLEFWRVNMRPGKPITAGSYREIPFIGLPGNPVSAYVGYEIFVRPALARLGGAATSSRLSYFVRLVEEIKSDGRESYLRAQVYHESDQWWARLSGHQGSGNLFSIVDSNALLIIPSGVKSLPAGSEVEAWIFDVGYSPSYPRSIG